MNKRFHFFLLYLGFSFTLISCTTKTDVLIIGGGASGTSAAIQAARLGVDVTIAEESSWLGGMLTSAGVSAVDGNYRLPAGLFGEFCDSLANHYSGKDALKTGWVSNVLFEPHVGDSILKLMVSNEPKIKVMYETAVKSIEAQKDGSWKVALSKNGTIKTIRCKVLIDGTELGDVAKECGVKYDVGMDSKAYSGEDIAPEIGNDIIQDLTYVAILKDFGPNSDKTIAKPENYDPTPFYCSCQSAKCTNPKEAKRMWDCESMLTYGKLPNNKYMINWPIEGNDFYANMIDMTPEERAEAVKKAKAFTLNFIYYMQTELGYKQLGLAEDEFPTTDLLPMMPYHRESRRIHGECRFTVGHVAQPYAQAEPLYRTGIAVGDYPVDHHHKRYHDWQKLPDLHFYPVPSYALPMGTLIPQGVENLIVTEKSISVSNLVNGTTRLQPVVMQIGQAAGVIAALAIKEKCKVHNVLIRDVQETILDNNGYIMPYLDLPVEDTCFEAVQRIGATGLLKGEGKNVGWHNETWFYTDSLLVDTAIGNELEELYPYASFTRNNKTVSIQEAFNLIDKMTGTTTDRVKTWNECGLNNYMAERAITRKEFAVIVDSAVDPFAIDIDFKGNFILP